MFITEGWKTSYRIHLMYKQKNPSMTYIYIYVYVLHIDILKERSVSHHKPPGHLQQCSWKDLVIWSITAWNRLKISKSWSFELRSGDAKSSWKRLLLSVYLNIFHYMMKFNFVLSVVTFLFNEKDCHSKMTLK